MASQHLAHPPPAPTAACTWAGTDPWSLHKIHVPPAQGYPLGDPCDETERSAPQPPSTPENVQHDRGQPGVPSDPQHPGRTKPLQDNDPRNPKAPQEDIKLLHQMTPGMKSTDWLLECAS